MKRRPGKETAARRHLSLRLLRELTLRREQWKVRAFDRRHLESLDDHVLCDMGLKRLAVEREARKPFWRPLNFL